MDAICRIVAFCAAVGIAEDQAGFEPSDHAGVQGHAARWQSASRAPRMGGAVSAQCGISGGTRGYETHARSSALRLQLVVGDWHRLLSRSDCLGIAAGVEPYAAGENFLEDAGAHAARGHRDLVHARTRVRNPLLGAGRSVGPGLHAYGMGVSVLWDVSWMAGRCADRKRYVFECAVWQPTADYFPAT